MIPNKEKEGCSYLAGKETISIITWNNVLIFGDFCCLNFLHSFRIENKLKSHEKVCKNKDSCRIVMPSEKNNNL